MAGTKYTRIEIVSGPDERNRYVHFRNWLADYHPGHPDGENRTAERGQIFHSALPSPEEMQTPNESKGENEQ